MAITSAICNSFKQEILEAEHNFTASSGNTFNLALYDSDATLNKSTTAYTTSEELATTGGYTAKAKALTSVTPTLDSDTAVCDFSNVSWTSASFTARGFCAFVDFPLSGIRYQVSGILWNSASILKNLIKVCKY